jgi:hypothetical protein
VTMKIKTIVYLEDPERARLEQMSKDTGAPVTELVRRAVTDYLDSRKVVHVKVQHPPQDQPRVIVVKVKRQK